MRDRTRQQLDPAGTTGLRFFTATLVVVAVAYAVTETVMSAAEISTPTLAVVSLIALGGAAAVTIVRTSAYRPPVSRGTHFIVQALIIGSIVLAAASTWGHDLFVRDDWGSAAAGLFLLAFGPYRPVRENVFCGVMMAAFIGFIVLMEERWFVTAGPPVAFVIMAAAPVLLLCFGGAAYSLGIIESIERWQRHAGEATEGAMSALRGSLTRSVQQDRVSILSHDVLPFFSEVLAREQLTDADRDRAHEIAVSIRNVMVAEANRSWLQSLIENSRVAHFVTVDDDGALATAMTIEQRTALRTVLIALLGTPTEEPKRLKLRLGRDGDLVRTTITAAYRTGDVIARSEFAPYFATLRSAFESFEADFGQTSLRLRFWYEQQ